jgi:hypothetical protein
MPTADRVALLGLQHQGISGRYAIIWAGIINIG